MELKFDFHIHSLNSLDGYMTVETIAERAKKLGLSGVAICDHGKFYTGKTEVNGITVVPGMEFATEVGHILGLFMHEEFQTRSAREAIDGIHAQGGIAILAHPYELSREPKISEVIDLFDGIETFNGRAAKDIREANALAEELANGYPVIRFGNSDAHNKGEIGNGYTVVDTESASLEDVKAALLARKTKAYGKDSPAYYRAITEFVRLKKKKMPVKGYKKWVGMTFRCIGSDIRRTFGRKDK